MVRARLTLLLAAAIAGAAAAQESDGLFHDGRWLARVENLDAGYLSASVEIVNFGGFWLDTTGARGKVARACAGRKFPITVQRNRTTDIEFMVWGSAVSPACPDLSIVLKPVDDRTLEGTVDDGKGRVRMTRRR